MIHEARNLKDKNITLLQNLATGFSRWWFTFWHILLIPLLAITAAMAFGALILSIFGYDPINALGNLSQGIFGNQRNLSEALVRTTPIIFTATGVSVAYSCSVWNIGAEGQYYFGAIVGTWIGIHGGNLPGYILIPIGLIAGFLGGGFWGSIPGWLKARFRVNEVVMTVMLNYISLAIGSFLVTGPMKEKAGIFPQTDPIVNAAVLPKIWEPTRLHLGFIIAIGVAILMAIILFRTPLGFAIRTTGKNPQTARYAGMQTDKTIIMAMFLSGGVSGLGGAVQVYGITHNLQAMLSPGVGFTGISVSVLVGNNPLGTILSGFLFGALQSGSEMMQINTGIPSELIQIIQGITVAFVVLFGTMRLLKPQPKQ
jgi:simple sugar transport system permease protein